MKKKEQKPFKLFGILCVIITIVMIAAGTTLLILKFCGYPYLFESLIVYGFAFIFLGITQLMAAFEGVTNTVIEYVGITQNLVKTLLKRIEAQDSDNISKIIIQEDVNGKSMEDFTYLNDLTKEQIEEIKERMPPPLKNIFETFNSGNKKEPPKSEPPIEQMSVNELYIAQKKAVDEDKFEKAAAIKKEIQKRQGG